MNKPRKKSRVLRIPVDEIDWDLLREQRVHIGTVSESEKLLPLELAEAASGIWSLLAYLQDEAAKVLGEKAVFGTAKGKHS